MASSSKSGSAGSRRDRKRKLEASIGSGAITFADSHVDLRCRLPGFDSAINWKLPGGEDSEGKAFGTPWPCSYKLVGKGVKSVMKDLKGIADIDFKHSTMSKTGSSCRFVF